MAILSYALDILFPAQCLNCNTGVPAHGTLCLPCWQQIQFISDPFCHCCGHPFDFALGEGVLCAECMQDFPPYAKARAVFRYDDHSRALILKLKYADQTQLAAVYGPWLAKAGREVLDASDVIMPVPLHYWRFIGRRYNQSALLANAVSRTSGKRLLPDGLKRIRATVSQTGLTRKQRADNVDGAFVVSKRHKKLIKGKTVLLVDDVMTTAATLKECTEVLLKSGAMQVNVLTLARTVNL